MIAHAVAIDRLHDQIGKLVIEPLAQRLALLIRPIGKSIADILVHYLLAIVNDVIHKRIDQPIREEMMHSKR